MRSIKTTGGLTRGRGMTESQRAEWVLSMPDCAELNLALQELTSLNFRTSDQHKEEGDSRRKRDSTDIGTLASFIAARDPYIEEPNLRNIETGVTADPKVNVDIAKEVGLRILDSINDVSVGEFTFKRKKQAIQMNEQNHLSSCEMTVFQ